MKATLGGAGKSVVNPAASPAIAPGPVPAAPTSRRWCTRCRSNRHPSTRRSPGRRGCCAGSRSSAACPRAIATVWRSQVRGRPGVDRGAALARDRRCRRHFGRAGAPRATHKADPACQDLDLFTLMPRNAEDHFAETPTASRSRFHTKKTEAADFSAGTRPSTKPADQSRSVQDDRTAEPNDPVPLSSPIVGVGLWLVVDRSAAAKRRGSCGASGIVVEPSDLDRRAAGRLRKRCPPGRSSRNRPIRLWARPFCIGWLGALSCQADPRSCCQARIACEVSSVPFAAFLAGSPPRIGSPASWRTIVADDRERPGRTARRSDPAHMRRVARHQHPRPAPIIQDVGGEVRRP